MSQNAIDAIFNPQSVAVVGASNTPSGFGYWYMHAITSHDYKGNLYPINPKAPEVMGIKAYPDLEQVPTSVDYVISLVGLNMVPDLLTKCARKGVKVLHVMAGRGAETGRPEAKKLEDDVQKAARETGVRLLGPNCLGTYCPKTGIAYHYDFPKEPGNVSVMMQSGGNSIDTIHFLTLRGIRLCKVVSYGNAIDINQNDLLEYFGEDPDTQIILCFIEGVKKDARKFLEILRKVASKKPVVILKGGRTAAGARQTLTHTASLAGSGKIFDVAVRQAGAIPVSNLDELVNQAVAFQLIPPIKGKRVGLGGGGGGKSVLTADEWEEQGFEVPPLPQEIRDYWKNKGSQLWDWISNPVDRSTWMTGDPYTFPEQVIEMSKHPVFDFIVGTVTEDYPFEKDFFLEALTSDVEGFITIKKESSKPFLLIYSNRPIGIKQLEGWEDRRHAELKTKLVEAGIPFFASVPHAAKAVQEMMNFYARKEQKAK